MAGHLLDQSPHNARAALSPAKLPDAKVAKHAKSISFAAFAFFASRSSQSAACVLLGLLLLLVLPACAGTNAPPDEMLPPPPSRQSELVRIYDTMCGDDESAANAAARQAAAGDDKDHRFLASLWGSRPRSAPGARRLGAALSAGNHHQKAYDWFERAFLFVGTEDPLLPWLRYEMAQEYVALGRNQDAINLLANRMGTQPLPPELKVKYDELIRRAS
jgi:hypothetical protein